MTRTPRQIRSQGNRLKTEGSLYLRQHAHNPIDWYPWGSEALERSRAEDRPIFLSVGYASCHWCHVMEREVFEDDQVADLLNNQFVCIKLDREERPDLDAVYMEALQTLSGGGGWPMSLFLTPDLKPFHGETYVPAERFIALARRVADLYANHRQQLESQAALLYRRISSDPELSLEAEVDAGVLNSAVNQAAHYHDPQWGGFRGQMKFPTPPRWRFLLHHQRRHPDSVTTEAVRRTLDSMASGGIYDQLGGGFHRYTVEPTWLVPHFEKMLYDNAQLAGLFAEASRALDEPRYAEVARGTLDFMLREMQQAEDEGCGGGGGFYASFDADSGGEEGSYYVWSPAELRGVAGEQEGEALCRLLGVTEAGNFKGRSILTRRVPPGEVAAALGLDLEAVEGLLDRWRPELLAVRDKRVAPGLDRKLVTAWNGLAISAMAQGFMALGEPRYLQGARRAADFMWEVHRAEGGGLYRSSNGGVAANEGVLSDYALLAQGLLDLYQATQEATPLRRALTLLDHAVARFAHKEAGFYQTPDHHPAPLGRRVELLDSTRPSANAAMARALVLAGELCGRADYREQAARMIGAFSPWMRRFGLEMAAWMDAASALLGPTHTVVVAGESGADDTRALLALVRGLMLPNVLLVTAPANGLEGELAELLPPAVGKTALNGKATAYVCEHGSCQAPVETVQGLKEALGV